MFEVGQEVTVISDKGVAYEGIVLVRAKGDDGQLGAYRIGVSGNGLEQLGQWHKAADVFVQEKLANNQDQAWEILGAR
jgi:hypothetical protein